MITIEGPGNLILWQTSHMTKGVKLRRLPVTTDPSLFRSTIPDLQTHRNLGLGRSQFSTRKKPPPCAGRPARFRLTRWPRDDGGQSLADQHQECNERLLETDTWFQRFKAWTRWIQDDTFGVP